MAQQQPPPSKDPPSTMSLQEAIEILEDPNCIYYRSPHQERRDAEKLGIEALKLRLEYNHKNLIDFSVLLPGETKD